MKFLLFTLLCSFTGVLFASNHVASDSAAVDSSGASFTCDALLVKGDQPDTNHLDALGDELLKGYLASFYTVQFPALYTKANSQSLYYYDTRAPPVIA
jgi:hypothetical protein